MPIFFIKNIYTQMENGRTMVLHSAIIGVLLYLFMIFILGQNQIVAENRSILLAAVILMYMILFGHGLPTSINKNLF
jgi:ACR3 family arsenite efflux pump ArsB